MKCTPLLLISCVFVAMWSQVSTDCSSSCSITFAQSVSLNSPSQSAYCSAYNSFKSCVSQACGSSIPAGTFDNVDKILKDNGISCNSGRSIQLSLSIIFGCIYIALSVYR